jgi:hypothetical protein
MLVKSLLYGDISEKPMMGMLYPFSTSTLTFVRTIKMFVEIFCHHSFSFWWRRLGWVASSSHIIHKLNKASLKEKFHYPNPWQALKTSLSRISATDELCTWLCLNSRNHRYVIGNVCLSRHRKADLILFRSCIQTLASLTHFVALKPDRTKTI